MQNGAHGLSLPSPSACIWVFTTVFDKKVKDPSVSMHINDSMRQYLVWELGHDKRHKSESTRRLLPSSLIPWWRRNNLICHVTLLWAQWTVTSALSLNNLAVLAERRPANISRDGDDRMALLEMYPFLPLEYHLVFKTALYKITLLHTVVFFSSEFVRYLIVLDFRFLE